MAEMLCNRLARTSTHCPLACYESLEYYIPFLPLIHFSRLSLRVQACGRGGAASNTGRLRQIRYLPVHKHLRRWPARSARILSATHTSPFSSGCVDYTGGSRFVSALCELDWCQGPLRGGVARVRRPARVRFSEARRFASRVGHSPTAHHITISASATTRWDSGNEAADNHCTLPQIPLRTPPSATPLVLLDASRARLRGGIGIVSSARYVSLRSWRYLPTTATAAHRRFSFGESQALGYPLLEVLACCSALPRALMVYLWGLNRYWGTVSFLPVPSWPVPSDVSIEHCAAGRDWSLPGSWNDFPNLRGIPGNSEFSHGDVTYQPVDGLPDSTARKELLDKADGWGNRCRDFQQMEEGPWRRHPHEEIRFQIYVRFPRAPEPTITSFSIMADINFNHLWIENSKAISAGLVMPNHPPQALLARNVTLHSSGRIEIPYLVAEYAPNCQSAGDIQGVYNASRSLSLFNSMGPLHADINLINDGWIGIQANINLVATNNIPSSAASYEITAQTRKGLLDVHIASAPVDSSITLGGWNIDGTVYVKFPPGYEGCYYTRDTAKIFRPETTARERRGWSQDVQAEGLGSLRSCVGNS
ncbi:hypothetical protein B0H13DRAFT_1870982 [Mycena leptocephala]|nr:hypothetical protein B0H13DRAFT_1870982 [Mycena leptocephala]